MQPPGGKGGTVETLLKEQPLGGKSGTVEDVVEVTAAGGKATLKVVG